MIERCVVGWAPNKDAERKMDARRHPFFGSVVSRSIEDG